MYFDFEPDPESQIPHTCECRYFSASFCLPCFGCFSRALIRVQLPEIAGLKVVVTGLAATFFLIFVSTLRGLCTTPRDSWSKNPSGWSRCNFPLFFVSTECSST